MNGSSVVGTHGGVAVVVVVHMTPVARSSTHGSGVVVEQMTPVRGSSTHGSGVVVVLVQGSPPGMVESSFGPHGRGVVVAVDASKGVVVVSQP